MAKWGEGDPRWIVEERPDATNVNNWHWVEKNATGWSKDKLRELLEGLVIEDDNVICNIKDLTKVEGEASANNRKAKLIFFYDWSITAKWKGKLKASSDWVKGTLDIPNLSDENDASEIDVSVATEDGGDEAYIVKEYLRVSGTEKIRESLACYIQSLKEEYGQGVILPTKTTVGKTLITKNNKKEATDMKTAFNNMSVTSGTSQCDSSAGKFNVKTFNTTEEFKCRTSDLFRALTNQDMVKAYAGHGSTVNPKPNGQFCLFDGNVSGYYTELEQDKKITCKWRLKSWPSGHYSNVFIIFQEAEDCTKLILQQNAIPESEFDNTVLGWTQNYWSRIKSVFGFGAKIF